MTERVEQSEQVKTETEKVTVPDDGKGNDQQVVREESQRRSDSTKQTG